MPPATQPGRNGPATQISFQFENASIDAVLRHLSETAGFTVIKEIPVSGNVTVMSRKPMSTEEAIGHLNSFLKSSGATAIQTGNRTLKVMSIDAAKKGSIPVNVGNRPEDIPQTDDLVTQVIPIRTVDAARLRQDLVPLIGTIDIASNAASNTIIVTDTSANVRRIVQIIANLDRTGSTQSDIKFKQLLNADATAAATLINSLFKPEPAQGQGGSAQERAIIQGFQAFRQSRDGGGGPGRDGGGRGGGDQGAEGRTGSVNAQADTRTNTVIVTGPPAALVDVMRILEQLDAIPVQDNAFFMYSLKNAQAIKLEAVLNTLFGNTSGNYGLANRGTNYQQRFGGRRTGGGLGSLTGGGAGAFGQLGGGGGGGGQFGGGGGRQATGGPVRGGNTFQQGSAAAQLSPNSARSAFELVGQVFVVADEDTNSLLVTTSGKYEKRVRGIIAELDRPVPQVVIKVLVAEVTHDDNVDIGVDFSILNRRANGFGQTLGTDFLPTDLTSGLVLNVLEENVTATLRALAVNGKLDVLSRPYILASDNQLATIQVGQEVPLVDTNRVTESGQQITDISYRPVGIILDVVPHINPEGLVIMDVAPEISQLTNATIAVTNTVSNPVIAVRSAESRVAVRNGHTIVIGGLMEDRKATTVSKVPILGDLPLVGAAFRRTIVSKTKRELLIFLTPHVALRPDTLKPMSQDETRGTKLTPNAVEPGTFDDHLRGMRRGATPPGAMSPEPTQPAPAAPAEPGYRPVPGSGALPGEEGGVGAPADRNDTYTRPRGGNRSREYRDVPQLR